MASSGLRLSAAGRQSVAVLHRLASSSAKAAPLEVRLQQKVDGVTGTDYMNPNWGEPQAKKPVKVDLVKGEQYSWCVCGQSRRQPFCDGSHTTAGTDGFKPVRFVAQKTGPHMLCMCKMSTHRPLCDGSHRLLPPGALPSQVSEQLLVAFDHIDPDSHVARGTARKLGLNEKKGFFK